MRWKPASSLLRPLNLTDRSIGTSWSWSCRKDKPLGLSTTDSIDRCAIVARTLVVSPTLYQCRCKRK